MDEWKDGWILASEEQLADYQSRPHRRRPPARLPASLHLECRLIAGGPESGVVDDAGGLRRLSVVALFVVARGRPGDQCAQEIGVGSVEKGLANSVEPQSDPPCLYPG